MKCSVKQSYTLHADKGVCSLIADALERLRTEPTCDVETAAGLLGISRGLAYQEARQGSLGAVPVLRIGHRLRVVVKPLLEALRLDA